MTQPPTLTAAEARLFLASMAAAAAYRSIFGNSCWNQRDRQAFAELDAALVNFASERQLLSEMASGVLAQTQAPIIALPPTQPE